VPRAASLDVAREPFALDAHARRLTALADGERAQLGGLTEVEETDDAVLHCLPSVRVEGLREVLAEEGRDVAEGDEVETLPVDPFERRAVERVGVEQDAVQARLGLKRAGVLHPERCQEQAFAASHDEAPSFVCCHLARLEHASAGVGERLGNRDAGRLPLQILDGLAQVAGGRQRGKRRAPRFAPRGRQQV
jgi:hypothetical protein